MAHTYTSCVEQPASRMVWSLTVLNGMTVIQEDAGNALQRRSKMTIYNEAMWAMGI